MSWFRSGVGASLLATLLASGCMDLEVTNPNAPTASEAIADVETAEALIGTAFQRWHDASYGYHGPGLMLSAAAFQHSTPWLCHAPYSWIPRTPLANDPGAVNYDVAATAWYDLYATLTQVADALRWIDGQPGLAGEAGEARLSRARAVGRFVQGLAHGSLALLYDRGFVLDEQSVRDPLERDEEGRTPLWYPELMEVALDELGQAAALASGQDWEVPAAWMSVPVPADGLARLAHSFSARFRAGVARTPEERSSVDWAAVMADVEAGVTESWILDMDPSAGFHNQVIDYGTWPGWALESYFIVGMADQSGSFQRWLSTPLWQRVPDPDSDGDGQADPILIVTPDTRFPRGSTLAEQEANPGSLYAIPDGLEGRIGDRDRAWAIRDLWARPNNGSWRWSYYWHIDTEPYTYWVDTRWPEIPAAEMTLLQAEGRLRSGDRAAAAALINLSRTAAGLSPTDAAGTNVECVPRLPDGSCGDLLEMLKWEKRLETHFTGPFAASWYFDGRGWGDLFAGTFLQLPIPCGDLETMGMTPCYTFGGVGRSASPGTVYDWPDEPAGAFEPATFGC